MNFKSKIAGNKEKAQYFLGFSLSNASHNVY